MKLVTREGRRVAEVARHLGMDQSTLRLWAKRERSNGTVSAGEQKDVVKRNRELEAPVQQLLVENDILKKAAAYFAREQR